MDVSVRFLLTMNSSEVVGVQIVNSLPYSQRILAGGV